MKTVTRELVQHISAEARQNQRLRKNHNFHPSDMSRCHRLLNAIEPGSYIRPHRHQDQEKDEAFVLMAGRLGIVTFSDAGEVAEKVILSHAAGNLAVDIPHGVYHTALSLESGTVFYEVKAGPYLPLNEYELPVWAPAENNPQAQVFLAHLRSMFD